MSLRIGPSGDGEDRRRRSPDDASPAGDFYMDRLVKLIPAEAITAYPFLHSRAVDVAAMVAEKAPGAAAGSTVAAAAAGPYGSADWLPAGVAWLLLIVVILLRWQATRGPNGDAQWGAVLISAVSFLLWVPVLDGATGGNASGAVASFGIFHVLVNDWGVIHWPPPVQKFVPELLLVLWTILVPALYKPAN